MLTPEEERELTVRLEEERNVYTGAVLAQGLAFAGALEFLDTVLSGQRAASRLVCLTEDEDGEATLARIAEARPVLGEVLLRARQRFEAGAPPTR